MLLMLVHPTGQGDDEQGRRVKNRRRGKIQSGKAQPTVRTSTTRYGNVTNKAFGTAFRKRWPILRYRRLAAFWNASEQVLNVSAKTVLAVLGGQKDLDRNIVLIGIVYPIQYRTTYALSPGLLMIWSKRERRCPLYHLGGSGSDFLVTELREMLLNAYRRCEKFRFWNSVRFNF